MKMNVNGWKIIKLLKIKVIVILLIIFVAVLILTKYILDHDNRRVDISDYIKVSYTGLQSKGKVNYVVDTEKLYKKLAGEEKNTIVLSKIRTLIESITIKSDGIDLSNEDVVTIVVSYDKEMAKKTDCKLKNSNYKVKVFGLGKGQVIDIFENIEVIIAGISPDAYANVSNKWTDEYLKNISFTIENPTKISKGDSVRVRCNVSEEQIMEKGYIIKSLTKDFKVEKVNSYITEVSQIDLELLKTIKNEVVQTIKSETEDLTFRMFYKATKDSAYLFQYNNEWVNNTEFVSAVYLNKKDKSIANTNNYIYLLFKSNISNGSKTSDIYFAFEYTESIITTDGKCTIIHNNQSDRYICGLNFDDIYGRVITSKENAYFITPISNLN